MNLALEDVLSVIARAPRLSDRTTTSAIIKKDQILNRLAIEFAADPVAVRNRLTALKKNLRGRQAQSPTTEPIESPPQTLDPWDRELVALLIQRPHDLPEILARVRPEHLAPGPYREIFSQCCVLSAAGVEPSYERLTLAMDDPHIKSVLVDLDEVARGKSGEDSARQLQDVLDSYCRRMEAQRRRSQTAALRQGRLNEERGETLLKELIERERHRQGISGPTDGQDASSDGLDQIP